MAMNTYEKVKSFVHEKEKVLFMGWQCPSRVKAVWVVADLKSLCPNSSMSWQANVPLKATSLNLWMIIEMRWNMIVIIIIIIIINILLLLLLLLDVLKAKFVYALSASPSSYWNS